MKPLSYSSATLLSNCEQRYVHRKVLETKVDPDFSDSTEAFDIGKSFHKVLEDTLHSRVDITGNVKDACKEFNVLQHRGLVEGMVENYLEMHEASGLSCVLCEFEISEPNVIGYIDAIMVDDSGNWWIVDLKTSARWDENILSRLPYDYQLNLYVAFAERLSAALNLDIKKLKGCRYRVTTKSKANPKTNEGHDTFVKRIKKAVKSYDVIVPIENMHVDSIYELHMANYNRAKELFEGRGPQKNLSYCISYFRPCEYFSQCHGKTFTELKNAVQIKTADIYNREIQDIEDL